MYHSSIVLALITIATAFEVIPKLSATKYMRRRLMAFAITIALVMLVLGEYEKIPLTYFPAAVVTLFAGAYASKEENSRSHLYFTFFLTLYVCAGDAARLISRLSAAIL